MRSRISTRDISWFNGLKYAEIIVKDSGASVGREIIDDLTVLGTFSYFKEGVRDYLYTEAFKIRLREEIDYLTSAWEGVLINDGNTDINSDQGHAL